MRLVTALLAVSLISAPALAAKRPSKRAEPKAAPVEEPARATNAGWNGDWALTFGLNNVLTQGSVLSNLGGLATSGARFLSPTMAVRAGLSLSRNADTETITRTELSNGSETTVSYSFVAPGTSTVSTTLGGDLLFRLREGAVAPFAGVGLTVGHSLFSRTYRDDISVPDQVTTLSNVTNSLSLGVRGILGAEWRFHESFAVFAEYQLGVTVLRWNDMVNETIVENTSGGARTAIRTQEEASKPVWLTYNNALAQGGVLGLLVFF